MDFKDFLELSPYDIRREEKQKILLSYLKEATIHHKENCKEYANYVNSFGYSEEATCIEDMPFLPIGVFKELDIKSIKDEDIFKVLTSSGTTGQQVSKVYLDHETASWQQKALCKIMESYIGKNRVPFLIVDSPQVLKNRDLFSSRGAAILGFSMFASSVTYALNEDMELNWEAIEEFEKISRERKTLIFGFTFLLWESLVKKLEEKNKKMQLSNCIILHGGGWKKLQNKAVDNDIYKKTMEKWLGTNKIYNYYGMAEQTGTIYMECEHGYLHTSTYSDIVIRDKETLQTVDYKKEGLIEVLSPFPRSYPGHILLTEDVGMIVGEDDCPCHRRGKYFKVTGRIKKAQIRGCSDTHG